MRTGYIVIIAAMALVFTASISYSQEMKDEKKEIKSADVIVTEQLMDEQMAAKPQMSNGHEAAITTSPLPILIRKVSVLVESTPSNSDIEVDGVYVGATPLQVSLKEGVHHMKVSREGYLAWERAVKAYNGLYVGATLAKESTKKREVNRSATAQ